MRNRIHDYRSYFDMIRDNFWMWVALWYTQDSPQPPVVESEAEYLFSESPQDVNLTLDIEEDTDIYLNIDTDCEIDDFGYNDIETDIDLDIF